MVLPHARALLLLCCGASSGAQAAPGPTSAAPTVALPDLGPPAALPDGAPALLAAIDRVPRGRGAGADVTAVQLYRDLARRLEDAGATAGIVALREDPGAFGNTLNYHALLPDHPRLRVAGAFQPMPVPLFVVAGESAAALLDHLGVRDGQDGRPTADAAAPGAKGTGRLQIVVKSDHKGSATNVVAVLRGTDCKREAVVFSAHHGHVGRRLDGDTFNGADDGEHPDYHQVTDHADRLDYPRMEAVARLAAWSGWIAAEAKGRPETLGPQADW